MLGVLSHDGCTWLCLLGGGGWLHQCNQFGRSVPCSGFSRAHIGCMQGLLSSFLLLKFSAFLLPSKKKRCENIKFQEPEMVLVDVEKKYRNYFLQDVVMRKMEKAFSKVPQGEKVLFLPQIHLLGMGFLLGSFHLGWDFPSSSVRVPLPALCFQAVQPYDPLGKAASLCSPRAFSLLPCPGFSFIVAAA